MNIPPMRKQDHTWARTSKEKAEVFADHLERTFQPNEEKTMDSPRRTEEKQIKQIPPVTPKEILNVIKVNIHPKEAPGFDLITGEILKQLPKKSHSQTNIPVKCCFPSYWKATEVIVIQKPGKPATEVTSYRPISLLPVLSKRFEKLLLKRLKPILDEKQIIPTHHFGFRNNHSTIHQVHRITTLTEKAPEEKQVCSCILRCGPSIR